MSWTRTRLELYLCTRDLLTLFFCICIKSPLTVLFPDLSAGRSRPLRGLRRSRQERHTKDAAKLLLLYDENLLENDPHRESKDMAFAQSYLNRVRGVSDLPQLHDWVIWEKSYCDNFFISVDFDLYIVSFHHSSQITVSAKLKVFCFFFTSK